MLETLLILSVVLIAYTYVLFPLLCWFRAKCFPVPFAAADIEPSVSLIVACYNEERDIPGKLENILAIDYPDDKFEVIVASDGSTDRTNEIVRSYEQHGIRLLELPRQGKAQTLNTAISHSKGEILVFSDSNSHYEPRAIRKLVQPFADNSIGGVAGNQCYLKADKASPRSTGQGEHTYWNIDRLLKLWESQAGNTISATGAIYAIRRSLFQQVPDGVTDDFTISSRVIAQGKRLVFEPHARSWEPVAPSAGKEFNRKVRIMSRGLRAVWIMRELLNPFRYGFYSWQLFSHKVLRRQMYIPLLVVLATSLMLCPKMLLLIPFAVAQVLFYLAALVGWVAQKAGVRLPRIFFLPFFFCLVNVACIVATYNVLAGRKIVRWQPKRGSEPTVAA